VLLESAARRRLLSTNLVDLRIVLRELAPPGDGTGPRTADNHGMTMKMLGRLQGGIDPSNMLRVQRSCSHAHVPSQPAAGGYRYHDLGGEMPPFYLRRFRHGDGCAAVTLAAPLEMSSGGDAERGAPGVALVQVNVGARMIPWESLLEIADDPEVSALLARAALEAVFDLQLLEREDCPICE
jgi:hypothetical protein